jgi:hypothetical protein
MDPVNQLAPAGNANVHAAIVGPIGGLAGLIGGVGPIGGLNVAGPIGGVGNNGGQLPLPLPLQIDGPVGGHGARAINGEPIQLLVTQKNKPKFGHEGHYYNKHKASKADPTLEFWACEKKNGIGKCYGRIHVQGGLVVGVVRGHNHAPEPDRARAILVIFFINSQICFATQPDKKFHGKNIPKKIQKKYSKIFCEIFFLTKKFDTLYVRTK